MASCLIVSLLLFQSALRGDGPAALNATTIDPLPAGWKHGMDNASVHSGSNSETGAHFELIGEPKLASMPFPAWCQMIQKREAKDSPLSDRKETPPEARKIGDYDVMSYEITGSLFGEPMHYRIYGVALPHQYAELTCWCSPKSWEKASAEFDELVKAMK